MALSFEFTTCLLSVENFSRRFYSRELAPVILSSHVLPSDTLLSRWSTGTLPATSDMLKRGFSCVYFPRRKKGEDAEPGPLTRHICVNYEVLEKLFHLPLKDAAREIGLSLTTFKKACRRFHVEYWPSRKRKRLTTQARRNAQTHGVDTTLHQQPVCAPAAPTLQTPGVHQDKRAATVSCTSPVWHDGSIAWSDTPGFCFSFSSNSSKVGDPFGAVFSSAAPEGLFPEDTMALDTGSYCEARHAWPAFQQGTFAPLDAPSCIDSFTTGQICIGAPMPEGQKMTGACGGEQGGATPLVAAPLSCVH
jgi:hypothetical protein